MVSTHNNTSETANFRELFFFFSRNPHFESIQTHIQPPPTLAHSLTHTHTDRSSLASSSRRQHALHRPSFSLLLLILIII